jgi:peptidoglycan/LPS O-acetylase OafA/YrhL
MKPTANHLSVIDPLRGIAALSVAWFHFTNGGLDSAGGWLRTSGKYGWLGVEVFFVVSGFIIPYSLWRGGYVWPRDFGRFLLKRWVRLDPPYWVAIALALGLWHLSALTPGFAGRPPEWNPGQLAAHLGYLNAFIGYPWIIPVFWTLAVEVQFYLLVGLIFPLLTSASGTIRTLTTLAVAVASLFPAGPLGVFPNGALFALGIVAFHWHAGWTSTRTAVALITCLALVSGYVAEPIVGMVGGMTAGTIAFVRLRSSVLSWFGTISFSLYLVHVPIGGKVVNLGARYAHHPVSEFGVAVAAVLVSVFAAWVMYLLVERPMQRLSSKIKYSPPESQQSQPLRGHLGDLEPQSIGDETSTDLLNPVPT